MASRRDRFARVLSVAKAVFLWLRTGEVQRHRIPQDLPARQRMAGQAAQSASRTAGH
jgi:hypothetical protein